MPAMPDMSGMSGMADMSAMPDMAAAFGAYNMMDPMAAFGAMMAAFGGMPAPAMPAGMATGVVVPGLAHLQGKGAKPDEAAAAAAIAGYGAVRGNPGVRATTSPYNPNMKGGDWLCGSCGNHNFASRLLCNKCHRPKSAPAAFREGDWMCGACGNHNFANKTACNKCKAGKS